MSDNTSEPYHVFPKHPNQSLHMFAFVLVIIGLIGSVVWHARKDQAARTILSTGRWRLRIIKFALLYVLSPCLIISLILISISGDPESVLVLVFLAIAYEGILNWYLLFRYKYTKIESSDTSAVPEKNEGKVGRLGRRLVFVTLLVLYGASVASSQFDDIDYYGPVRITGMELYADRPRQDISNLDPKYYYYYTLQENLEWGNDWGCPSSRYGDYKWCEYSHFLDKDEYGSTCKKQIDCQGNPPVGDIGECATESQKEAAFTYLKTCVLDMMENDQIPDSSNVPYFSRDTPPWLDVLRDGTVATTATRTVAASCQRCETFPSVPPENLTKQARVAWLIGCLMGATTVGMLVYDRFRGEKPPIFYMPKPHDLELS